MKKILTLLLGLCLFASCAVTTRATVQEGDGIYETSSVSYDVVVTYGTPYYIDGVLSYYLYNNIYYYPYLWRDRWYFRPYRYMQPRGFVYRPERYHRPHYNLGNYRHNDSWRKPNVHHGNNHTMNHRPSTINRPQHNRMPSRNSMQHSRPMGGHHGRR